MENRKFARSNQARASNLLIGRFAVGRNHLYNCRKVKKSVDLSLAVLCTCLEHLLCLCLSQVSTVCSPGYRLGKSGSSVGAPLTRPVPSWPELIRTPFPRSDYQRVLRRARRASIGRKTRNGAVSLPGRYGQNLKVRQQLAAKVLGSSGLCLRVAASVPSSRCLHYCQFASAKASAWRAGRQASSDRCFS